MSHRLLPRLTGVGLGTGIGLALTLVWFGFDSLFGDGLSQSMEPILPIVSVGCAVLTIIIWYAAPDRSPGRPSLSWRGSLGRIGSGFASGLLLTAILIVPVAVAAAVVITIWQGWAAPFFHWYFMCLTAVTGVALSISLALAAHAWLDAPPEHSTKASPSALLRQDRTSSLTGGLTAGAVLGISVVPLLTLGWAVAFIGLSWFTNMDVAPSAPGFVRERFDNSAAYGSPKAAWMSVLLPGMAFTLLVLLTRAWPRFSLLRLFLAAQGKLPWRLMRFLADARDRQLLRQSAGAYQFRHIRLQERLAGRSLASDRDPAHAARTTRRRRIQGAVAATVLALGVLGMYRPPTENTRVDTIATGDADYLAFDKNGDLFTLTEHPTATYTLRRWGAQTGEEIPHSRRVFSASYFNDYEPVALLHGGILRTVRGDALSYLPWEGDEWSGYDVEVVLTDRYSYLEHITPGGRYAIYSEPSSLKYTIIDTVNNKQLAHSPEIGKILENEEHVTLNEMNGDLAYADAATLHILDAGKNYKEGDSRVIGYDSINAITFNADGTKLAVNADGVTRVLDLDD
jgi:hypothetical protein